MSLTGTKIVIKSLNEKSVTSVAKSINHNNSLTKNLNKSRLTSIIGESTLSGVIGRSIDRITNGVSKKINLLKLTKRAIAGTIISNVLNVILRK